MPAALPAAGGRGSRKEPAIARRLATDDGAPRGRGAGRALVLGTVLCAMLGVAVPAGTHLLLGSFMDLDYSTPAAVFVLFVLVSAANPLLRAVGRWRPLAPRELLLIYSMLIVACAVTGVGMASQLVPMLAAPRYFALTNLDWRFHVLPLLQTWMVPDQAASRALFEGLRHGQPIPWGAWARPLASWAILLVAFYTVSICLMAVLRRQWVDNERLAFPLTQLPIALANGSGPNGWPRLFSSRVMWAGFALAFGLASLHGAHHYRPTIPDWHEYWEWFVFRRTSVLTLRISLPMIGYFFLANADVVFSLWVFNRAAWLAQGWMNVRGVDYRGQLGPYSGAPLFGHIALGALIGLVLATLRSAWPHLRRAVRCAMTRGDDSDAQEPMSYRTALIGIAVGLAVMGTWLRVAGMPLYVVGIFLFAAIAIPLAMTRIVIESGMAEAVPPSVPSGFVYATVGSQALSPHALLAQAFSYVWVGDMRTLVMTSAADAYRMGPAERGYRRSVTLGMFIAFVVAGAAAVATTLYLAYTRGGLSLQGWFFVDGPQQPFNWLVARTLNRTPPRPSSWGLMSVGGAIAWLLALLSQRYPWWPLHPIGFAIGPTWIMDQLWLSALISWLVRGLVLRYGGLRGYRVLRPFFLGLILGQFAANGAWLILDALTGARGNTIFWI